LVLNTSERETEIDKTMMAVAHVYKDKTCGILLSGMGEDGGMGIKEIKQKGGYCIVQDPDDATVGSMPRNAMRFSDVDQILRADSIPEALNALVEKRNPSTHT
jgi:two-component system chemotaxis response regulator CheB